MRQLAPARSLFSHSVRSLGRRLSCALGIPPVAVHFFQVGGRAWPFLYAAAAAATAAARFASASGTVVGA